MHQQPTTSIWGTINSCIEIALNIYMIIATDENGKEHTGIMAKKDIAHQTLSEETRKRAKEDGEWLYFDEKEKEIPMYELLQRRVVLCKQIENATRKELEEIKNNSKGKVNDSFGECLPPEETEGCKKEDMSKIRNGIYFVKEKEETKFAIHKEIVQKYVSVFGMEFGKEQGDYYVYDLTTSAIPLYELKSIFKEIEELIVSEGSLYATLNQKFPFYTNNYNQLYEKEYQIPEKYGATDLFLKLQLEQEERKEEVEVWQEEYEQDFNEEIEFEFGR